jgi:hypothetical protein
MRIAVLLLCLAFLAGCDGGVPEDEITDPGLTVTPQATNGILLASETPSGTDAQDTLPAPDLRVRLPDEYLPSQAVTMNLDLDETEEQIIVFKRRDDPDDLIRILVVTFDPIRNNWIRAWEGTTAANIVRSFTLYTDDLTGDLEQEIVCFGINNAGEQTLDVFRRTSNTLGLGLAYTPILSISADVNITIEEVERSAAYEAMESSSGRSYPIVAERRDRESESIFATVRTSYFWDVTGRRYVQGFSERIPGNVVQDSRLADLFAGNEESFERFLDGPWYRSTSEPDRLEILSFGLLERTIVFHSGYRHLQQAYRWDESAKTVYGRGLQVFVTNESITSIQQLISVSVQELNQITINIQGSEDKDGTYLRLTGSLQTAVLATDDTTAVAATPAPRGLYQGDDGLEIVFTEPEFVYRDGNVQRNGGYAIYRVNGTTILELKFVDANRLPVESWRFSAELTETADDDRLTRRLTLEPGVLGLAGFSPTGDPVISLEQIELLEESDAQ